MSFFSSQGAMNSALMAVFGETVSWQRGASAPVNLACSITFPIPEEDLSSDAPPPFIAIETVDSVFSATPLAPSPESGDRVGYRGSNYVVYVVGESQNGTSKHRARRL